MSRALGRYELVRPLARGGMAEVYLARRRAAGVEKWLVVKRMRPERSRDVRFLDLFVREARLSMSLAHQNIVPVFDFGRIDDQVFLAMERVEGKDLGSSLAKAGRDHPMPALLAAFVAAECCQALDYAHRRKSPEGATLGIVHRDVTPRNVMLSWSGEVKLTDFGIAALAGDETTRLIGTPAYMAPEQARGEPLDARADVYAIGLVLREALTGERARPGGERDAIVAAARTGELLPWPDGAPAALTAIVDRATALDPGARYPDASTMLADLDAFIVGERAARKGESPNRQVATWLAVVWGNEREISDSNPDMSIPGEQLVSFLDDGELDVVGTGTQRSMAATADESIVVPPLSSPAKSEVAAPRRSWIPVAGAAVAAVIAAGVVFAIRGGDAPPPPPAPQPQVAPAQVHAPPTPPPPARVEPPVVVDKPVEVVKPPVEAKKPPDARTLKAVPPKLPPKADPQVKPPDVVPRPRVMEPGAPARPERQVTINARPGWAYFTIDDDATQHQTVETVSLPPGPHRIHFTNPQRNFDRTVTIDVPPDRDLHHVEQIE
jgi:serine/threonine-protein kinase